MDDFAAFRSELTNNIAIRAEGESSFQIEAFAEELGQRLEAAEVVFDLTVEPLRCTGRRGRHLELLGFAEDEADASLVILTGVYFEVGDATLGLADAKRVFGAAEAFVEQALDGWLEANLEMSSKEAEYASYLRKQFHRFDKVKFVLVTDGLMSDRIKTIPGSVVASLPSSYAIWDARRFEALSKSTTGRDDIHVEITSWLPEGLPVLVGAESGSLARSYLAVLPGQLLADVFQEYGSQILESNVRTYLSARGKVNKGIQSTLAHEPEMFLAYNNGLTTTAASVETVDRGGFTHITSISNWQIVNGGQTTSSLAHFLRQAKNRTLDGVFVQMKLVTVEASKSSELVSKVSRYANSQNKVNEADFFSNSPFHVRLEQISLRLKAPAAEGVQFGTAWFYERTRGQYENTRNALPASAQKRFELEFPKTQKIAKIDWAKYAFCWSKRPYEVSRGAQSNFMAFAGEADKIWEANDAAINDEYFRSCVAKAIAYNELRAAVMKSDWYASGYLANIVAYGIAKFSYEIDRQFPGFKFNYAEVWLQQGLSTPVLDTLLASAELMQKVLTDSKRPQSNVTQWAKQEACWDVARERMFQLPSETVDALTSRVAVAAVAADARRERRIDESFEAVARVMKVEQSVWNIVVAPGSKVSPTERSIIERIRVPGSVPSERQAARAVAVLQRCVDNGLLPQGAF